MKSWQRKSDLLVEETLVFAQGVVHAQSHQDVKPIQTTALAKAVLQSNLSKPKDTLFEREVIRRRVAISKRLNIDLSVSEKSFSRKRC